MARLQASARQLRLLSHQSVLERGFALVLDEAGKPVRRADAVAEGDLLTLQLAHDQSLRARVDSSGAKASGKAAKANPSAKKPRKPTPPVDDGQGKLL